LGKCCERFQLGRWRPRPCRAACRSTAQISRCGMNFGKCRRRHRVATPGAPDTMHGRTTPSANAHTHPADPAQHACGLVVPTADTAAHMHAPGSRFAHGVGCHHRPPTCAWAAGSMHARAPWCGMPMHAMHLRRRLAWVAACVHMCPMPGGHSL